MYTKVQYYMNAVLEQTLCQLTFVASAIEVCFFHYHLKALSPNQPFLQRSQPWSAVLAHLDTPTFGWRTEKIAVLLAIFHLKNKIWD